MATYATWRSNALAGGKAALSNITDATSATDANGTDCDKAYWEANAYDQLYSMFTTLPTNPDKGVDGDLWVNYNATTNQDSKLVFQTNDNVNSTNPEILWDASEAHFAFNNAVKVTGTLQATGNITGTFTGSIATGATAVTQSPSDDSTAIATTAFVHDVVDTEDTISELNDTTISSPADGHLLLYNQQTSSWRNQSMDGDASISDTGTITLAASQSNITSLGTLTALQVDNVNINGSTISNSSGTILVEGTTFSGNDVTIAGNLTVDGTHTYLNTTTLDIEDKNIQVNKNSTTTNAIDAGLIILGNSNTEVGYFKVGTTGYDHLLLFKAPAGEQFKINATAAAETITIGGSLNIEADSNINQDVTTDASVSFGQLDVDNVRVSGNTISSTDTNGNIVFDPNGTGTVKIAFQNGTYMTIPNADGNNGQVLATSGAGTLSWVDATSSTISALSDTVISSPSDGHLLLYNQQTSSWRNEPVTGDISITTGGVAAIVSGVIVNADISSSAAIADSKLATLTTSNKVGGSAVQLAGSTGIENSSGLRVKSNLAGNGLSMTTGSGMQSMYISTGGVSTGMIADDAVTADKIADGVIPSAYSYWTLGVGGTSANVLSGHNVYFAATNGLDIAYSTSGDKTITFSHEDTSSQASVNNSGTYYIQDITLDTYGHITGITTGDTAHGHSYLSTGGGTLSGMLTINGDLNVNSSLLYAAAGYDKVGIGYTPSSGGGKLEVYGGASWTGTGESIAKFRSQGADARIHINSTSAASSTHKAYAIYEDGNTSSQFSTGLDGGSYKITTGTTLSGTERLKIDSSGNWTTNSGQFNVNSSTLNIDNASGTPRLEIDSSGNWNIGDTGTNYNVKFRGDTGAKAYWTWYSGGGIDKFHYMKRYQPSQGSAYTLMHINAGSEEGSPGYNLIVSGTIYHSGIYQSSDSRLKSNIANIETALDNVTQLQGVTFNWKESQELEFDVPVKGEGRQYGFIAQDVEKVLPDIVQTDNVKSLKYDALIPMLVEAIKELKAEVDELKAGS